MSTEHAPEDGPESIPHAFAEAWNRRDPDGIAALFEEDAEFVNVTGLWWHDRASILKAHRYGLSVIFDASELTLRQVTGKRLRNDVAVVHAQMRLTGQTPPGSARDGTRPQPRTTVFSFVVHRIGPDDGTGERWSCASAQNTDVVPGMETHLADADGTFRAVDYRRER